MKALILTVTAGYGHNATAKAIEDGLIARGVTAKTVDVYKYVHKIVSDTVDKTTALYARYTPDIYRIIYEHLDKGNTDERLNVMGLVNYISSVKFEKLIGEYNPDIIVCTHVFAAQIVEELKCRDVTRAKLVGIITDYTIHPYWETISTIDYCIVASQKLFYRAMKKGIPGKKLMALGIPIHSKFEQDIPKEEARKILGLEQSSKVVLVMGGGLGLGFGPDDMAKILDVGRDVHVMIVCGSSKKLFRKFSSYKEKNCTNRIIVYGFVDNVHVLMSAADIFISKPGGLSVTEAFSKKLPMIIVNPLAGQEERNSEFLLNCGLAMFANKTFSLDEAAHMLLTDEHMRTRIIHSIEENIIIGANDKICNFLVNLI